MVILIFFIAHWFISLFFHTVFLHRYAAHGMFTLSKFWEKSFYLMTFVTQGSSFLNPRAYAIMHRMHHEYSDTEKDPHSPMFFKEVFSMMRHTFDIYSDLRKRIMKPEAKFESYYPVWAPFDWFSDLRIVRLAWGATYILFYYYFATEWWMFLLLPVHFLIGPVQGAIVNWSGHKYGYSNYENGDHSRNSLPMDFLLLGELFQNNHHYDKDDPNFAKKWFEIDPVYPALKLMDFIGIIKLKPHLPPAG